MMVVALASLHAYSALIFVAVVIAAAAVNVVVSISALCGALLLGREFS